MAEFIVNAKDIGIRIRNLRLKQNKTQSYYADLLYISPSYLALIEAGKRIPNIDVLVRISTIADVSLDYIIFGKDDSLDSEQKAFDRLRSSYPETDVKKALKLAEFYLKLSKQTDSDDSAASFYAHRYYYIISTITFLFSFEAAAFTTERIAFAIRPCFPITLPMSD